MAMNHSVFPDSEFGYLDVDRNIEKNYVPPKKNDPAPLFYFSSFLSPILLTNTCESPRKKLKYNLFRQFTASNLLTEDVLIAFNRYKRLDFNIITVVYAGALYLVYYLLLGYDEYVLAGQNKNVIFYIALGTGVISALTTLTVLSTRVISRYKPKQRCLHFFAYNL